MDFESIFEALCDLWTTFVTEHQKHVNGNASAGVRARKALGEIKKQVTDYRKLSVEITKNKKADK